MARYSKRRSGKKNRGNRRTKYHTQRGGGGTFGFPAMPNIFGSKDPESEIAKLRSQITQKEEELDKLRGQLSSLEPNIQTETPAV